MSQIIVSGKQRIQGALEVQGSKNLVLPILVACLLIEEDVTLTNCPDISDVAETIAMLESLGAEIRREESTIHVNARNAHANRLDTEMTKNNRMSILLLGAMLGRFNEGYIALPGGCHIGKRPVDLHEKLFRELGCRVIRAEGNLFACTNGLRGTVYVLEKRSVGVTENCVITACLAEGTTTILGAAREPEVEGLCDFLRLAGAKITWRDTTTLQIDGVERLHGVSYRIFADRIVAGTYLSAAAITGGECELNGVSITHMEQILDFFADRGCSFLLSQNRIYMKAPERLVGGAQLQTGPYPGFPTDMQPFATACLCLAKGESVLEETVFENRFDAIRQMQAFGVNARIDEPMIRIQGTTQLKGSKVTGKDLRGTCALIILALACNGESVVNGYEYVERGYEDLVRDLALLGCTIRKGK